MYTETQRFSLTAHSFMTTMYLLSSSNNNSIFVAYILANLLMINLSLLMDWLRSDPVSFHRFFRTTHEQPRIRKRQVEVRKYHEEGKTQAEIAFLLECGIRTVKRDLEELGLTKKRNKKPDGT